MPSLTVHNVLCCWRHPNPVTPERGAIYWNLQWDVPMGWVSLGTLVGGTRQSSLGSHCPATSHTCGNTSNTACTLERGEGWGFCAGTPPVHLLMPDWQCYLPRLANRDGKNNQLRFLKLPTCSRPGGHAVSHWPIIWSPSLFLCWPEAVTAQRCPY